MSNVVAIKHPFLVRFQGGVLDGHQLPMPYEPERHATLQVDYEHSLLSTPAGTIKATRAWQRHLYLYLGAGKATPIHH